MLLFYLQCAAFILVYMSLFFFYAMYKQDNSVVDVAWGTGFILIAWYTLIANGFYKPYQILVTALVTIWGMRLSWHIYLRNRGRGEDPRYAAWRRQWVWVKLRSFLQVFMLQGIILLIIAYPIIFINSSITPNLGWFAYAGLALWLFGFMFESIGDYQLKQFLADARNRGHIMRQGLWNYTRHPNYFGESCMWWGIFIIACGVPLGWTTFVSPLLLTYLLLYVSGIPLAEQQLQNNPEFKEYARTTNSFFPWFVRKK
jgi:steroid 5-alpha reductase family enzyme